MFTFSETITLTKVDCGTCGGTYAINERYREKKREQGGFWHCPYCECAWGYAASENQKLKKELEQQAAELRAAKCEALSANLLKEEAQKKLRRVDKGVCPCCKRSFTDLRRHMETKHPKEFSVEPTNKRKTKHEKQ
jgi:hypothetical protein